MGIAALAVFIRAAAGVSYANDTREENSSKTNPVSKQPPFGPYMLGGFNGMRGYRQFSDFGGFVQQVGRAGKGTSLYGLLDRGYLREPVLFSSALRKQVDGDQPGAISDYLALLELQDKDPAVHWYLGTAYQATGKMAEAKQEFEKERLMRKDALRMEREWRFDGQRGDFGSGEINAQVSPNGLTTSSGILAGCRRKDLVLGEAELQAVLEVLDGFGNMNEAYARIIYFVPSFA